MFSGGAHALATPRHVGVSSQLLSGRGGGADSDGVREKFSIAEGEGATGTS